MANASIRRLAPPLSDVLAGFPGARPREAGLVGRAESVPRYTAELVLDLLTRSPHRAEYLTDPAAQEGLRRAMRGLLAGALGISTDDPILGNFGW